MFERQRSSGGNSANRWLVVAGAGLVILALVARMLLDIGHTSVPDLTAILRPDSAAVTTPAPDTGLGDAAAVMVDTMAQRPSSAEVSSSVPAPEPTMVSTPPTPAAPPTSPPTAAYAVQIGAFGSEANARRLAERASALGYTARVIPQPRGSSELYVVRVEELPGAPQARLAADSLARVLGVNSVVFPPGR